MNKEASNKKEYVLIIGDIHANDAALRAAFTDAFRRYPGKYLEVWFLGDLFGRGPQPGRAFRRLLREKPAAMIQGNHEGGLIGRYRSVRVEELTSGLYNGHDWEVLLLHREELHSQGLLVCENNDVAGGEVSEFISQLPVVCVPRPTIFMVHGGQESQFTPPDELQDFFDHLVWDYVKERPHAEHTINAMQWIYESKLHRPEIAVLNGDMESPELILVGHYHMRFFYDSAAGDWQSPVRLDQPYAIEPIPERPFVLSPGSIGFPREDDRDASYAVLEMQDGRATSVVFHTCAYDRQTVRDEMARKSYPEETVKRLRLPGETELVNATRWRTDSRDCSSSHA